jgi:hypothetical protein
MEATGGIVFVQAIIVSLAVSLSVWWKSSFGGFWHARTSRQQCRPHDNEEAPAKRLLNRGF